MNQLNLYHIPLEELLEQVKESFPQSTYNLKKHTIELSKSTEPLGYVRLPLTYVLDDDLELLDKSSTVLYLTIEAGNAAICVTEGTEITYHTTFSAYMTRKKQGFSQVKYLNKKGKSRAGSRVRLASTIEFFEGINTVLQELCEEQLFDRVALSCTSTLMPYLFSSKVDCPFEKQDPILYKIPLHIPQSNFTNLSSMINKLKAPTLFFQEEFKEELLEVFED